MIDENAADMHIKMLCDRFTPEELIEALGVTVEDVCSRYYEECLELDVYDE